MNIVIKLSSSAKLLLIEIKKNSLEGVCKLKDKKLAVLIEKSISRTTSCLSELKKAKKIKTVRTSSTERDIIILDN